MTAATGTPTTPSGTSSIERLTNDKSPQFHPVHFARQRARTNSIAKFEKVDDYTIAIYTKTVESLFPYNMAYWMVISKCALEAAGNDYKVYAKSPSGTGHYKFDMLGGVAMEGYGVFTPSQAFYGNPVKYTFDTKKANALLKEANCLPCNITVGISTSGSGQMQPLPMNELAKAQLEAAGFKVKFEVMDWNTLLATFWGGWEKNPNVDAINVSLSVLDPVSGFLKHFSTSNRGPVGLNWGWYENKEFDALNDKVQATFDEAERTRLLQHMHELVVA